jgi:bidirectional [NiFe] hydrogenase diaphorase subunit
MNFKELQELGEKERKRQETIEHRIFCCTSTACLASGSGATLNALKGLIDNGNSDETEAEVFQTGCMGLCSRGPLVRVDSKDKPDCFYQDVTPDIANEIVSKHVPSTSNAAPDSGIDLSKHVLPQDIPFFTQQVKVVLSDVGQIDPENLKDYLAHGGYAALAHVLENMAPEEICAEIERSGLRGRGGAGFPTGVKWNYVRLEKAEKKFVVVNGDEGDPGAYMDRTIMEYNPHRVLEGMMISAYAVGADYGYFYVRGEYPIAVNRLRRAIRDARRRKILGKSVMGTEFKFDADLRIGAGAFVCGEETALIHSIEGKRGTPRMRPPYPSTHGLWGFPTVINNVETIANVPSIINNGADWYADIGTEMSKGTKVFALTGQLKNTGLIEVPMGITLREIIFSNPHSPGQDYRRRRHNGRLSQIGKTLHPGEADKPLWFGSISMPKFARFFMDFCVDESCGKCVPCRVGTVQIRTLQIRTLLDKIIAGEGTTDDLVKLEKLCTLVKRTSLCGLGQSAPNPVISTLKYFMDEYEQLFKSEDIEVNAE